MRRPLSAWISLKVSCSLCPCVEPLAAARALGAAERREGLPGGGETGWLRMAVAPRDGNGVPRQQAALFLKILASRTEVNPDWTPRAFQQRISGSFREHPASPFYRVWLDGGPRIHRLLPPPRTR
jgi:hypothetical protein